MYVYECVSALSVEAADLILWPRGVELNDPVDLAPSRI